MGATALVAGLALGETADEAFERGNKLAKEGKIQEAADAFEVAWSMRQTWDFAGNLGFMEAELGKWSKAAGHLDYANRHMGGLAKPKQREKLEQRFADAKTHVGWVDITCTPGSALSVNGKDIGTCSLEIPPYLEPGSYQIGASLKGYDSRTASADVHVNAGAKVDLTLSILSAPSATATPSAAASAGAPPSATPSVAPAPRPKWPIAVGYGLTAVGLGVAIGLTVAANGDAPSTSCKVGCDDTQNTHNSLSNGALWSFVAAGAVGLATTGYLIWSVAGPRSQPPVAIVPFVSPQAGGFVVGGSF